MAMIKRNLTPVPGNVIEDVKEYLLKNNLGQLVEVRRGSDHPDDHYLYMVITRKPNTQKYFHNGEWNYFCWTCWNQSTKSMNYGHNHLETYEECDAILKKYFHKISGPCVID